MRDALIAGEPIEDLLRQASSDPGPAPLDDYRATIDGCFGADSVAAILDRLDQDGSEFRPRRRL